MFVREEIIRGSGLKLCRIFIHLTFVLVREEIIRGSGLKHHFIQKTTDIPSGLSERK